jgi:NAD(P)-dependent dehydrogenase (short-subunit alcohol dehydrogenase family)
MKLFELNGRVAVITGGNAGIGLGIAKGLAAAGAVIVIAGRRAEKNLEAARAIEAFNVNTAARLGGGLWHQRVTVRFGDQDGRAGGVYRDGGGGVPVAQYCYYSAPNVDQSSTRIDIASNGSRAPHLGALLVPDLEGALAKCQWWQA